MDAPPNYGKGLQGNLQTVCYPLANILFALGTISILLRIYSRAVIVKSFGWDDWAMTSILVRLPR